jgi:hypothetical protein
MIERLVKDKKKILNKQIFSDFLKNFALPHYCLMTSFASGAFY